MERVVVVAVAVVVNITSGGLRHKWQQGSCWACRPEKIMIKKTFLTLAKTSFSFFWKNRHLIWLAPNPRHREAQSRNLKSINLISLIPQ